MNEREWEERLAFATEKWRSAHAEVERLRAENKGWAHTNEVGLAKVAELWAEVERLRADLQNCMGSANYEVLSDYQHEVERLRAERDDTRVQRDTALTTLELSQAEVERLRAALERIATPRGDAMREQYREDDLAIARAALAKEET